ARAPAVVGVRVVLLCARGGRGERQQKPNPRVPSPPPPPPPPSPNRKGPPPPMPLGEEVVNDYRHLQLPLRKHPAAFLRPDLDRRGIIVNEALRRRTSGERVTVSGLIIIRQRPGTAKAVLFMTPHDETACPN